MNEAKYIIALVSCFLDCRGGEALLDDLLSFFEGLDIFFHDPPGLLRHLGFGCSNGCVYFKMGRPKTEQDITQKPINDHGALARDIPPVEVK